MERYAVPPFLVYPAVSVQYPPHHIVYREGDRTGIRQEKGNRRALPVTWIGEILEELELRTKRYFAVTGKVEMQRKGKQIPVVAVCLRGCNTPVELQRLTQADFFFGPNRTDEQRILRRSAQTRSYPTCGNKPFFSGSTYMLSLGKGRGHVGQLYGRRIKRQGELEAFQISGGGAQGNLVGLPCFQDHFRGMERQPAVCTHHATRRSRTVDVSYLDGDKRSEGIARKSGDRDRFGQRACPRVECVAKHMAFGNEAPARAIRKSGINAQD